MLAQHTTEERLLYFVSLACQRRALSTQAAACTLGSYLVCEHHQLPQVEVVQHPHRHTTLLFPRRYNDLTRAVVGMPERSKETASSCCGSVLGLCSDFLSGWQVFG